MTSYQNFHLKEVLENQAYIIQSDEEALAIAQDLSQKFKAEAVQRDQIWGCRSFKSDRS